MVLTSKQLCTVLFLQACCAVRVDAAESKDYRKLVELGFAHLECASFGMLTADDSHRKLAQKSFVQGSMMLVEWLDDVASGKANRTSIGFAPKEINLMPVPGPPTQFHIGYIWAQVEMHAQIRSSAKSTSWFFAFGETVEQLRRAEARKQFENAKCELLN